MHNYYINIVVTMFNLIRSILNKKSQHYYGTNYLDAPATYDIIITLYVSATETTPRVTLNIVTWQGRFRTGVLNWRPLFSVLLMHK